MKALKIIAGVVVVVVIGLVIFVMTFDIGKYKGLIEQQAKAATGRDVAIGDIHMGLSLTPTIILQNVTVANAPWGSKPQMVTMKSVEAKAELLPLLSKQVNITKIALDGADILLETNKQGQGNWEFPTQNKEKSGAGGQSDLNVSAVDGSNLHLTMKDAKTGQDTDMTVKSVALRMNGPLQQMAVTNLELSDATLSRKDAQNAIQASIGKVALESSGPIMDLGFKKLDVSNVKVSGKNAGGPLEAELDKLSLDGKGALDLQAKYNGDPIRATGTVATAAALKSGQKALPMKLTVEGMGLKGDVDLTVDAAVTPPSVKGTVNIPEIDMTKFSSGQPAGNAAPAKGEAKSGPMFSNDPLPWDSLHSANADVKVTVGTVKLANGQAMTNVSLPIKLQGGQLAMNGASIDMAGGKIQGDVDANAGSKAVTVKGTVKGMTAESLAKAYKLTDLITNGPLDVAVDVHGAGASPHAIASTLSGSFFADLGESKIRNDALNMVGAQAIMQVLSAVNPLGNNDPYTVARCAVANLQIANGIANTQNGIAAVTDKMSLSASGKIDLGEERLDMIVKPTVNSGLTSQIGKIVSEVKVTGPIQKPSIGIDTAKAIGGLAATFGGKALGGNTASGSSSGGGAGGGLLGALAGAAGGGKLFGGGASEPAQQQPAKTAAAAPSGDLCAAARNWNRH